MTVHEGTSTSWPRVRHWGQALVITLCLGLCLPALLLAQASPPPDAAASTPAAAGSSTGRASAAPAEGTSAEGAGGPGALSNEAAAQGEDLNVVYTRNLREIEERVNSLKERVFRSKARLQLLRETVLQGVVSGAKAVLFHVNQLGGSYMLESLTYFLDGTKIYSRSDVTGELSKKQELKIFEGNIPAGNHQVSVNLQLRGNGFGVFSYLNNYKFKVQHSYNFIAEEGKISRLRVISFEKGGLRRDFKDRPSIRYDLVTDRSLPSGADGGDAQ